MQLQSRNFIIASGVALTMVAVSGAFAADSVVQSLADVRQESQIWTTYALSPHLRANDIHVSVRDGKATLSGKVEEGVGKDLAKQIALGVNGIREVDNQIEVQADYVAPAPAGTRSYGQVIDDTTISAAVKSKLTWSKYLSGPSPEVDTQWGKVTLKGTADNATAKDLAGRLALNTRGVLSVDNQLTIGNGKASLGDSAKQSATEAGRGISDSWITTKVKSTFLYSSNVAGSDISVTTRSGIVTLSGKLNSGVERALAIELAKNVRGVRSVQAKGLSI
ncbi:BON domain-containing protein [Chitinimonas arctica]|uniref:BON domain-containing protein n=1 Tax=Chitinimonas arctica TaxID=2594795 RepID=A0A516SIF9_9NEIS|nr:BON domain-containing protein [Chitinimonas arctica]QDQ27926.1 BON domain-containing protein [Chitinimonas arctica]